MRVLVTGATGYLGRAIVRALAARGHTPVAFSRRAAPGAPAAAAVSGDIRDREALARAMAGCNAVCHSAALVAVWRRRAQEFDEVNVGGLANVLQAAAAAGLARIVYTSSFLALPPLGSTEPRAWNDYQRTKVLADRLANEAVSSGAPVIRIYPGVIYGPGPLTDGNLIGRMIAQHLAGRLPGLVGADRRWSYAYIDDVAEAHVAALERGQKGGRYIVCGAAVSQLALFEIVRELTGAPLPRRIPTSLAAVAAAADEAAARLFGRPPQLTVGTLKILVHDWVFDGSEAREALGLHETPLGEGLTRVVAGLSEQHTDR